MTNKPVNQPQDKYVLRMPDGLRDRIKAYAERHGTSMNYEIVRVLERDFPEQWPFEQRLAWLADAIKILAAGKSDPAIANVVDSFKDTIVGIISGRVTGVDPETREAIELMWRNIRLDEYEAEAEAFNDDYTEEEQRAMEVVGHPEKYAVPPKLGKRIGDLTDQELAIFRMGFEAGLDTANAQSAEFGKDPFPKVK